LANEAAAAFVGKHPGTVTSTRQATAIDKYIADNKLPPWEPKSYEKANKAVAVLSTAQQGKVTGQPPAPQDVFVWFDEPAPASGAAVLEVVVTPRAYDGALDILRQARKGNTSVQSGISVLNTNYHPATISLASWKKSNPDWTASVFYWRGEELNDASSVMIIDMSSRAYENMLALTSESDLRILAPKRNN
jgi:hypothetical protein